MAEVRQGEIGDPHGAEGIYGPQGDDDGTEVITGGNGPHGGGNKGEMMVDQKVMMAKMTKFMETHQEDNKDPGDSGKMMDLWDLKDPWSQYHLHI